MNRDRSDDPMPDDAPMQDAFTAEDSFAADHDFAAWAAEHGSDAPSDPFFTARVLDALPQPLRFTGLTPHRRAGVLAIFHVLAAVVAYAIISWAAPETMGAVADQAHQWLEIDIDASAPWLTAVALGVVALVAFVSSRSHTRAT